MNISNNSNNSPIGFFDSGVGGLTVLQKVKKLLPNESFIFYGDTAHVPYGEKSKEQLLEYSQNILNYFGECGCKAVVMACNTTSSVIYNDIKGKYDFKLYPVVQSVAHILADLPIKKIGIFATKATISSGAYRTEIARYNPEMQIFGQYCPHWVHIVENNTVNQKSSIEIIKNDLDMMLSKGPEKMVLGCTHYPYLLDVLSKFAPREMFIDPAIYLAEFIKHDLEQSGLLSDSKERFEKFYVSAAPAAFKNAAKMFYDLKDEPQLFTF